MNKKRVGILVSTLLVLIMAFSLLAGCGLESFKKKVKKQGWEYEEYGRVTAMAEASVLIANKEKTTKVEKAIQGASKVIAISKQEGLKTYSIHYFIFDKSSSAKAYYKALNKTLKKVEKDSPYFNMIVQKKGRTIAIADRESAEKFSKK